MGPTQGVHANPKEIPERDPDQSCPHVTCGLIFQHDNLFGAHQEGNLENTRYVKTKKDNDQPRDSLNNPLISAKEPSDQAKRGTQGNKYSGETKDKEQGVQHHTLADMCSQKRAFEIIKGHPRDEREVRWQQWKHTGGEKGE
jgi:hypothetical protein